MFEDVACRRAVKILREKKRPCASACPNCRQHVAESPWLELRESLDWFYEAVVADQWPTLIEACVSRELGSQSLDLHSL